MCMPPKQLLTLTCAHMVTSTAGAATARMRRYSIADGHKDLSAPVQAIRPTAFVCSAHSVHCLLHHWMDTLSAHMHQLDFFTGPVSPAAVPTLLSLGETQRIGRRTVLVLP